MQMIMFHIEFQSICKSGGVVSSASAASLTQAWQACHVISDKLYHKVTNEFKTGVVTPQQPNCLDRSQTPTIY